MVAAQRCSPPVTGAVAARSRALCAVGAMTLGGLGMVAALTTGCGDRSASAAPQPTATAPVPGIGVPRFAEPVVPTPAEETALRVLRLALATQFERLRQDVPHARAAPAEVLEIPPCAADDSRLILYLGPYVLELPRALFDHLRSPGQFRRGGEWFLAGGCALGLQIDRELGLPEILREQAMPLDLSLLGSAGDGIATLPRLAEVTTAIRARLDFANEFEVLRAVYTTDFRALRVEHLAISELYSAVALSQMRSIIAPAEYSDGVRLVRTPHFDGLLFGAPAAPGRATLDLYDHGSAILRLVFRCMPHWEADAGPLRAAWTEIAASLRRHDVPDPGQRMLVAARRELAEDTPRAREIARLLVLCASRYDAVHAEAFSLGLELATPDVPYAREYLGVLHRIRDPLPLPATRPAN